ncbi:MAG: pur operon repressor [Bacillota bacterium]
MERLRKNDRVAALVKILSDNPNQVFTLNYFCDLLNAAKSTISEDVGVIKKLVEQMSLGIIETIPGAQGGVRYRPMISDKRSMDFLSDICIKLKDSSRIIPGSFIYMSDIMYNPVYSARIGEIFASRFSGCEADYVVTIETKGIIPALMTARALNLPLAIARRDNRVTEGATISINYVSGSSGKIQTMSLSKRSLKEYSKVIVIDDFMKAGGTVKGLHDLMQEFKAEVVGTGIVVSTLEPETKLISDYYSLLILKDVDNRSKNIDIEIGI